MNYRSVSVLHIESIEVKYTVLCLRYLPAPMSSLLTSLFSALSFSHSFFVFSSFHCLLNSVCLSMLSSIIHKVKNKKTKRNIWKHILIAISPLPPASLLLATSDSFSSFWRINSLPCVSERIHDAFAVLKFHTKRFASIQSNLGLNLVPQYSKPMKPS